MDEGKGLMPHSQDIVVYFFHGKYILTLIVPDLKLCLDKPNEKMQKKKILIKLTFRNLHNFVQHLTDKSIGDKLQVFSDEILMFEFRV